MTLADARRVVEVAYHARLPEGEVMLEFRLLTLAVDDVEVANPEGMDCGRLEAYGEITIGENE